MKPFGNRSGIPFYRRLGLLLVASALNVSALAQVAMAETPAINPFSVDFSGSWEMDYQTSDHASEKTRQLYVEARSAARRAAERARTSGRMIDPQIYNINSIVGLGRLAEVIAQATVLTISQSPNNIVIERNDDFALVCDFNNLGVREGAIGSEGCYWQGDQLFFRIALPDGLNILHRLSIAADRSRINVATTVKIDGIRYPFTLNRVYMPFEPGADQFQCEYTIADQTTCTLNGSDDS